MERELKFRIWDIDRKKWVKHLTYCIDDFAQSNKEWHKVMQYTGLLDKNLKEIYEGDIVKCGYGIAKVIFNAGCFMLQWIDDTDVYMEFVFSRKGMYRRKDEEELEVVGNIFENAEIIEKYKKEV